MTDLIDYENPYSVGSWFVTLAGFLLTKSYDDAATLMKATPNFDVNMVHPSTGMSVVHYAAKLGAVDILPLIQEMGGDLDKNDGHGNTPLLLAARGKRGNADKMNETIKFLVESNAVDINSTDKEGRTPIILAFNVGNIQGMKYLIMKGGSIPVCESNYEWFPLLYSKNCPTQPTNRLFRDVEAFILVLERMSDWQKTNEDGLGVLHFAARFGHMAAIKYLVEKKKAEVDCRDQQDATPIMHACKKYEVGAIRYLASRGANLELKCPVFVSRFRSEEEKLAISTVLWEVCKHSKWSANANVRHQTRSLLSLLAESRHTPIESTSLLIKHGADVQYADAKGRTALMDACRAGTVPTTASILIKNGANIHHCDNQGGTALHDAVRCLSTTKLLLEHGANVNHKDNFGSTPLHLACFHENFFVAKLLIGEGADVVPIDKQGHSPLHIAAQHRCVKTATLLIDHGADVNQVDKCGRTALMLSMIIDIFGNEKTPSIVKLLVAKGASIIAVNKYGKSAIEISADWRMTHTHNFLKREQANRSLNLVGYLAENGWFSRASMKRKFHEE